MAAASPIQYSADLAAILTEGSRFAQRLMHDLVAVEGFDGDFIAKQGGFDHICYRVATEEGYTAMKQLFEAEIKEKGSGVTLLKETLVGGRMIACYKLPEPFLPAVGTTVPASGPTSAAVGSEIAVLKCVTPFQIIELPAPKKGSPYSDGWEHGEVPFLSPEFPSFEAFMAKYPQLKNRWEFGGYNKASNADIALKVTGSAATVKFHELPLEEVIRTENAIANSC